MSTLFATQLILGATIIGNAVLILFVWTHNRRPFINKVLILEMMGILLWSSGIFANLWLKSEFVEHIIFSSAAIALVAQLYFVFLFPQSQKNESLFLSHFVSFALGFGCVFVLASFIPGGVFSAITVTEVGYTIVYPGWLSGCYAAFVFLYITSAIVLLAYKQKSIVSGPVKKQTRSLLFGFILFFITNLLTNSILPVVFNIHFFNGIGPAFSLILVAFIIYTISQHQFLEIRKTLQRSFIFSILLFLVIALYLSILTILGIFLNELTQSAFVVSAGVTTIIGIFSVPRIEQYLKTKTDWFFFKNHYNYAEALYELSEQVNKTLSSSDIQLSIEATLRDIFKTKMVKILALHEINPGEATVRSVTDGAAITLTLPITLDGTAIGALFLGEKESGDTYTTEDTVLVRTFSHQIAVAFEKARLYAEVQAYSRELEQRVEERTAQIHLLQAMQTHMMIDISHKLQNPLTILRNEITHLREQIPGAHELVFVEKTITDVSAFMYDLLQLARLDMALDSLEKEDFDVSTLVLELVEYFQVITDHEGIRLDHVVSPHMRYFGDKKRITELITNLVSNAVKYMGAHDSEDARITITLTHEHDVVLLTVTDTGIGISADDLPHIFERFYRAKNGTSTNIRGTGLGLAICKKIVDLHGGTIAVTSGVGIGTTFSVRL